jgi:hypothetical protein
VFVDDGALVDLPNIPTTQLVNMSVAKLADPSLIWPVAVWVVANSLDPDIPIDNYPLSRACC